MRVRASHSLAVLGTIARTIALAAVAACSYPTFVDPEPLVSEATQRTDAGSREPKSGTPDPIPSASSPAPVDDAGPPVIDPTPDAGPDSRTLKATLNATLPVTFGGAPYCTYRVALQQITLTITTAKNGDVADAVVTANAVEAVVAPCTYAPIAPNAQRYKLASATVLPNGAHHLELAASTTNTPIASLSIDGNLDEAYPALKLAWHRTDVAAPLDWRISAEMTASPQ